MSFTPSTTVTNVHQSLGDFPAEDDHLTSEQLKELFDAPATGLKSSLNGLIGELEATTSAASLGAAAIAESDTSAANVQAKLNKLYQDLQEAALGDIPDNTITQAKLTSEFSSSIAIKDASLQTGLNADQLDGYHASSFALKNGNLQSNLNAEKLGGQTKDQITSSIINRQSGSDSTYNSANFTTTEVLAQKSYTNTNKCRFLFIVAGFKGAKTIGGIYDCRTNEFILRLDNSTNGNLKCSFSANNLNLSGSPSSGYAYGKAQGFSYSNGTLTFNLGGNVTSSSVTNWYYTVKVTPLDGLLP